METLGTLCDKLTIIKLKQFHSEDPGQIESLNKQEIQLIEEIDCYVIQAVCENIPIEKLTFAANKVYKQQGNELRNIPGNLGEVFAELARVNCELWHEQENVYEFEKVPVKEKDKVVKRLAALNLERTKYIDEINNLFCKIFIKR